MKHQSVRYIVYGQICFVAGLALCAALRPHGLSANGGLSYYGSYRETILPYILMLLGPAYFFIKTAELFRQPEQHVVHHTLTLMSLLILGVMVTPASLNAFTDGLHRAFGIPLFVSQLLFSGWLAKQLRYDGWALLLAATELAGGIGAYIWLSPIHGWSLEAQLVFQVAFGGLLIYALPRLPSPYESA
jgi:CDP-diglyceride synthetase